MYRYTRLILLIVSALWTTMATAQLAERTTSPVELGRVQSVLGDRQLPSTDEVTLTSGTYAVFHTTEGDFIAALADDIAPETVRNFIGYASGQKPWRHPVTRVLETQRALYNNTAIYRTVPNSMIYGGDPLNRGEADSGTQLPLEVVPHVRFDQPGLLAMDSSGDRMMSGSRWYITLRPYPERTGRFTIFGKVIGGLDLVQRISNKPTIRPQMPLNPVMVGFIEIVRIPAGRMTTGQFVEEEGVRVLRIDPRFKDDPNAGEPRNIFAPPTPDPAAAEEALFEDELTSSPQDQQTTQTESEDSAED